MAQKAPNECLASGTCLIITFFCTSLLQGMQWILKPFCQVIPSYIHDKANWPGSFQCYFTAPAGWGAQLGPNSSRAHPAPCPSQLVQRTAQISSMRASPPFHHVLTCLAHAQSKLYFWSIPIPGFSQGLALGDAQCMLIKCHDSSKAFSGSSLPTSQPAPQHHLSSSCCGLLRSGVYCVRPTVPPPQSCELGLQCHRLRDLLALGEAHHWFPLFVCHWSQC